MQDCSPKVTAVVEFIVQYIQTIYSSFSVVRRKYYRAFFSFYAWKKEFVLTLYYLNHMMAHSTLKLVRYLYKTIIITILAWKCGS